MNKARQIVDAEAPKKFLKRRNIGAYKRKCWSHDCEEGHPLATKYAEPFKADAGRAERHNADLAAENKRLKEELRAIQERVRALAQWEAGRRGPLLE